MPLSLDEFILHLYTFPYLCEHSYLYVILSFPWHDFEVGFYVAKDSFELLMLPWLPKCLSCRRKPHTWPLISMVRYISFISLLLEIFVLSSHIIIHLDWL